MRERDNNFDSARLCFAIMVCLVHAYHLSGYQDLAVLENLLSTSLAVQGFFVISGYLIYQSYMKSRGIGSFYMKRVRRLYPAYLTVIMLCALLFFPLSHMNFGEYYSHDLMRYVAWNAIFLNFMEPSLPGVFEGRHIEAVNGALWTLKIEVMFYMAVPLIAFLCSRLRAWLALVGIYALSIAYVFICTWLESHEGNGIYGVLAYQFPGQMAYFAAGMLFFAYPKILEKYGAYLCIASLLFFILPLPGFVQTALRPAAVGTLVIYFCLYCRHVGNVSRHGDMSYGIYILHFPVIQVLSMHGEFASHPWIFLCAVFLVTLFLAAALWNGVEKRFLHTSSHYRLRAGETDELNKIACIAAKTDAQS